MIKEVDGALRHHWGIYNSLKLFSLENYFYSFWKIVYNFHQLIN